MEKTTAMGRMIRTMMAAAWLLGAAEAGFGQEPVRLGVFSFDRVSKETREGQRLQKQLSDFQEKKKADLDATEKELRNLQDRLAAQALSLSPERRLALEKEVQLKQNQLQLTREAAQRDWQIEFNQTRDRFQQQAVRIVEQIAREGRYSLIFENGQVVYHDAAVDITSEVIGRLDRAAGPPAAAPSKKDPSRPPASEK